MVYALVYGNGDEMYLYSTAEKAEDALIQRMANAVKCDGDLDFSDWKILACTVDEGEDVGEDIRY